jgi:hypothetical protein
MPVSDLHPRQFAFVVALDVTYTGIADKNVQFVALNLKYLDRLTHTTGQEAQWKAHHKKLCKKYSQYTASQAFQALPPNEKLDSLLLSHLVAELFSSSPKDGPLALLIEDQPTPFSTFSSLLSGTAVNQQTPPICPMGSNDVLLEGVLDELYSRFGNNNFAIHSHLVSIAHGIFPLASRLFNHSCIPNASAKYIFTESEPVRMDVVALREIQTDEEVRGAMISYSPVCLQIELKDMSSIHRSCFVPDTSTDLQPHLWFHMYMFFLRLC